MKLAPLDVMTSRQRLIVERALALAKELEATSSSAPARSAPCDVIGRNKERSSRSMRTACSDGMAS